MSITTLPLIVKYLLCGDWWIPRIPFTVNNNLIKLILSNTKYVFKWNYFLKSLFHQTLIRSVVVVVVAKYCFTSLFGTNGNLSDIVIYEINYAVHWWDKWFTNDDVGVGWYGMVGCWVFYLLAQYGVLGMPRHPETLLHWHRFWMEETGYGAAIRPKIMARLQLPMNDCYRLVLPYHAI